MRSLIGIVSYISADEKQRNNSDESHQMTLWVEMLRGVLYWNGVLRPRQSVLFLICISTPPVRFVHRAQVWENASGREMQQGDVIAFMLYNLYMDSVERDIWSIICHGGTKIRET